MMGVLMVFEALMISLILQLSIQHGGSARDRKGRVSLGISGGAFQADQAC